MLSVFTLKVSFALEYLSHQQKIIKWYIIKLEQIILRFLRHPVSCLRIDLKVKFLYHFSLLVLLSKCYFRNLGSILKPFGLSYLMIILLYRWQKIFSFSVWGKIASFWNKAFLTIIILLIVLFLGKYQIQ